jgi:hypothetical protein
MMAASGNNRMKNPKTRKIGQLMDKRKGNLTLCWVPGHVGTTGNEEADATPLFLVDDIIPYVYKARNLGVTFNYDLSSDDQVSILSCWAQATGGFYPFCCSYAS